MDLVYNIKNAQQKINIENLLSLLNQTIEEWGTDKQQLMFIEESSELNKEILKHLNRNADNIKEIQDEIVDVFITLQLLILVYGIDIDKYDEKMKRLEEKLILNGGKKLLFVP